jgi:hypothetical protein
MNECIIEISVHLSWSPFETKTTVLLNYPFTFPISLDKSAAPLPSCESEGPPVYITSPMTHLLTLTLKMEAACSPET